MHQKNCTEDWTDMMGLGALHCCAKSCKIEWIYHWHREASEAAGACWARSTISSVVVPMISFARFNGTHRILPIESWVENKDQPTEHLGLEILNWQILLFTEDYCGGLKSDSEDDILYPHLFCSLWWSSRVCEKNLPEKQYQAFLASLQHPRHQSCTPRQTLPWWAVHSVNQDPGKIIRYSNISNSFVISCDFFG